MYNRRTKDVAMDDGVDLVQLPMLVTVDQVAKMLGIGRTTAWELVRKQKIKSVKIGRTRRVPIEAIQEYIERLMNKDAA
jgi:excisionase family DNA binding protein